MEETPTQNVSRETLGGGIPQKHNDKEYSMDMESNTTPTAPAEATNPPTFYLLMQLVEAITDQVTYRVAEQLENIASEVAREATEEALGEYDPMDSLRYNSDFDEAVRDAVSNLSFSVTVD